VTKIVLKMALPKQKIDEDEAESDEF